MIRFHSSVVVGLGMALLGAGLTLFAPTPAATQVAATNVLVTNTTSQLVPVAVQGTPTVRIHPSYNQVQLAPTGNLVRSAQSGSWNVGIAATGNVVRVGNTKTSPIPTYEARDAQTPFQATLANGGSLTVPTGKRLVIEYVGLSGWVVGGGTYYQAQLTTTAGGVASVHLLSYQNVGTPAGYNEKDYSGGNATRIYADPGKLVTFAAYVSGTYDAHSMLASLSGYLVPYP
jgi:hypothetical protein